MLVSLPLGWLGIMAIVMIDLGGRIVSPWLSVIVNKEIPSKFRATTISTSSLLSRIPYVLLAIIAGQAAEAGKIGVFTLVIGIVLIALGFLNYLVFTWKSKK